MRWTRRSRFDEARELRTAKACGPGTPGLVLSLRDVSWMTVTKRSWTPGRARRSLLKPSRRECRCFGFICSDYACVLLSFAHKAAGAAKHLAFPAPSSLRVIGAKLGREVRRENAELHPVIPGQASKASAEPGSIVTGGCFGHAGAATSTTSETCGYGSPLSRRRLK